jgi:hypothetical protein
MKRNEIGDSLCGRIAHEKWRAMNRFIAQPRDPDRFNYPTEIDAELMQPNSAEEDSMLQIIRAIVINDGSAKCEQKRELNI